MTGNSHGRPGGGQEPLQSVLPTTCFQFIGQQWENGVRAPKSHAIYHHALHGRQSGLRQMKQFD